MITRMTQLQKDTAATFRKNGFSRHDSKVYAQNASQFMFQTGVSYVSGVMVAATVGAARMAGKGVGWTVGKAVDVVVGGVKKHQISKIQESGVDKKTGSRISLAEKKAQKAAKRAAAKADKIREEALEDLDEMFEDLEEAAEELAEDFFKEVDNTSGANETEKNKTEKTEE